MFIMCRPAKFPKPPLDEQTGNIKEACPYCGELMWVSDKKREMIKNNSSFSLVCMECIALREHIRPKVGLRASPIIDINKIEGSIPEVVEQCKKKQEEFKK